MSQEESAGEPPPSSPPRGSSLLGLLDARSWLPGMGPELEGAASVSGKAEAFYENTVGFLRSKATLDEVAGRELPRRFMDAVPSFEAEPLRLQQMPVDASDPAEMDLDAVYEVAALTLPKFESIVRGVVAGVGLDPDRAIVFDEDLRRRRRAAAAAAGGAGGDAVHPNRSSPLRHLVLAPLKGRGRALEKIRSDYGGRNAKILDVIRCSIVVRTEDELFRVSEALMLEGRRPGTTKEDEDEEGDDRGFTVVRCKNRFKEPLFNGYRDALYTIRIPVPRATGTGAASSSSSSSSTTTPLAPGPARTVVVVEHCCEVQVHLSELVFHKSTSHVYYEYFRSYFSGDVAAADERMSVLERVIGEEPLPTLAGTIESSVNDGTTARLEALLQLLGEDNMTEYALASRVAHRLASSSLEALPDVEEKEEEGAGENSSPALEHAIASLVRLGRFLRLAYEYDKAQTVLSKTRGASSALLGPEHRLTLLACENHAILMAETRRYGESERLHRSTLDARERVLGVEDPDTLSSCQVLAIVLDKPGRYEEARPCFERAYEGRRKVLGPDHRDTLDSANGLAVIDMMNGRYDSAESIFRATIKTQREKYGLDHAKTKWTANNLAGLLMICGRDEEAQELAAEIGLS